MIGFIDARREHHGVEPMWERLPLAVSTYHEHKARESDPDKDCPRACRDRYQKAEIQRLWNDDKQVYGTRKVWRQRESFVIAPCTVERLMKALGIQGLGRGGGTRRTTIPDDSQNRPSDRVNRRFSGARANPLWVVAITFVASWSGFVYVAFVIDLLSRYIVGWRISRTMWTQLVLDPCYLGS